MMYELAETTVDLPSGTPTTRRAARIVLISIFWIALACWAPPEISFAQEFLLPAELSNENNANLPSASLSNDSEPNTSLVDSLRLRSLDIELEQARLEAVQTDFIHRLIPQVHLSASIGFKDMLFIDPSYSVLSVLPKDAYRLNLSLSLRDLFDFSKHRTAELKCERLQADITRIRQQQQDSQSALLRELSELEALATLDSTVLALKEDVLNFNGLRFQQGKIEYDVLIRSKLDVLSAKRGVSQLNQRINDLRLKLHKAVQK